MRGPSGVNSGASTVANLTVRSIGRLECGARTERTTLWVAGRCGCGTRAQVLVEASAASASGARVDDLNELGLERRAADEEAVHVRLQGELLAVRASHRAYSTSVVHR